MTGRVFRVAARMVVALSALALAGCGAASRPVAPAPSPHVAGQIRPLETFLTVTTSAAVTRDATATSWELVSYPVTTLQLRSVRTGRVVATLLHRLGGIDAVMTRSGSVIAVVDDGCRSQVLRIDPQTARSTLIRVLPGSATDVALSPDGRQLAYLTYPSSARHACGPVKQPASPVREEENPGGPAEYSPNVLAVVSLSSGATVRAATSSPGQPPSAPAWSPDGRTIAVTSMTDNSIILLSAAHPDFASAPQIPARRSCAYQAVTWTVSGLVAVCGRPDEPLSPNKLVEVSATGRQTASWQLPACINGVAPFADPTFSHILVEADIGYGNGAPCGLPRPGGSWIRILAVRRAALDTIAVYAQGQNQPQLTGW